MNTRFISMLVVGLLGSGISVTYAVDSLAEKEVSPTIKERLTKDAIRGILMRKEGEFYYIKDNDGVVHRIHVDRRTKEDTVILGDTVRAYVTDEGHTTTLQHADCGDLSYGGLMNEVTMEEDERVHGTNAYLQ